MPDWYRTHSLGPEHYSDAEYRDWAQDNGLYVDLAGNVDYGPPEPSCPRGCPAGECYHAEPFYAEMNDMCGGCGGTGECYCGEE
ncbi:MAG TPA: hypothetical protein VIZ43_08445 [Trebonia sp.]